MDRNNCSVQSETETLLTFLYTYIVYGIQVEESQRCSTRYSGLFRPI